MTRLTNKKYHFDKVFSFNTQDATTEEPTTADPGNYTELGYESK